ncbi:unnamed protein product [Oppiella nova]|uniref:acid phosphatase n=1 Tax=Oppiella nova TaxID=334625 RepID=A0A7R9QG64_9ACAR|nr:unnamed protein product [Oppiella nova]CAG2164341.1 unnamed protein product [Oppiella nova]
MAESMPSSGRSSTPLSKEGNSVIESLLGDKCQSLLTAVVQLLACELSDCKVLFQTLVTRVGTVGLNFAHPEEANNFYDTVRTQLATEIKRKTWPAIETINIGGNIILKWITKAAKALMPTGKPTISGPTNLIRVQRISHIEGTGLACNADTVPVLHQYLKGKGICPQQLAANSGLIAELKVRVNHRGVAGSSNTGSRHTVPLNEETPPTNDSNVALRPKVRGTGLVADKQFRSIPELPIFRHGDRSPVLGFPTDPYSDESTYWPDGYHQLTLKGKQRMYSLGRYIRRRYDNFLGDSPREVYIRSSGKDRCLESAALVMAGLYPPKGRWAWDSTLGQHWQPFPIQTVDFPKDSMLNPDSECPTAQTESQKIMKSKTVQDFYNKYKNLVKFIEQKSGLKFNDYGIGRDLFNTLSIQKVHNYTLPEWVNQTVLDCLQDFHEMSFIFDSSTPLIRRLRAGVLLKEITNRLKQSISAETSKYKVFLYSTHDTQLSVFLSALNIYNGRSPPYGSTIFIELYETKCSDSERAHKLEVHYLNVTESEQTHRLPLNTCLMSTNTTGCQLNGFLHSIQSLIPNDWQNECKQSYLKSLFRNEL